MSSKEQQFRQSLEQLSRSMGYGTYKGQAYDMVRGYNHRANGTATPANTDQTGYTFVTRCELNLTDMNLSQDRYLTPLLTPNPYTIQRVVRAILDPHCEENGYGTPLFNNKHAFVTLYTNTISDVSGWPDNIMPDYVEQEGIVGEAVAMADGYYQFRGSFDLTCSFVNTEGAPILKMIDTQLHYMENVISNLMNPYPENNIENRMDYTQRMYRLIMDPSRRFVQHIMACGYMYPRTNPWGAIANYSSSENFDRANDKVNIQFRAVGAMYNDPILPWEFNDTVAMFNPDLEVMDNSPQALQALADGQLLLLRGDRYVQIPNSQLDYFTNECYPLIHPATWELMWFLEVERYREILEEIQGGSPEITPDVPNSPTDGSPMANPSTGWMGASLDMRNDNEREFSSFSTE